MNWPNFHWEYKKSISTVRLNFVQFQVPLAIRKKTTTAFQGFPEYWVEKVGFCLSSGHDYVKEKKYSQKHELFWLKLWRKPSLQHTPGNQSVALIFANWAKVIIIKIYIKIIHKPRIEKARCIVQSKTCTISHVCRLASFPPSASNSEKIWTQGSMWDWLWFGSVFVFSWTSSVNPFYGCTYLRFAFHVMKFGYLSQTQ